MLAVGRSILVIPWYVPDQSDTAFTDLGLFFDNRRIGPDGRRRNHARQLG